MRLLRLAFHEYGASVHRSFLRLSRLNQPAFTRPHLRPRHGTFARCQHLSTIERSPPTVDPIVSKCFAEEGQNGDDASQAASELAPTLPRTCPGCGALAQESMPSHAGYYSRSRKAVKAYLRYSKAQAESSASQSSEVTTAESEAPAQENQSPLEFSKSDDQTAQEQAPKAPVCDRCHDMTFNARGQSIAHPSMTDIADSIEESPFRRNHVYHVMDAVDFPMSLIPNIISKLSLAQPRSQNRRSRYDFSSKPTVSFIITRSDLLAPTKEIADSMMSYFSEGLRKALGRQGSNMRLGNVHLVSAKRGWWTSDIKESIWKRGGGNWMVGKVNVGKSNLFEVLFPKSSGNRAASPTSEEQKEDAQHVSMVEADESGASDFLSAKSLLPPSQPEVPFPVMPLVSSLPGTTASPIRIPFGKHKGELIDTPGLDRGGLENYVQPEHRRDLVMTHRPLVSQLTIKSRQSLVLGGGLIRITPCTDADGISPTMLAYTFVPISTHVTSTEKAIGLQLQERESNVKTILAQGAGESMQSAGLFDLGTDVTKLRSGPLLRAGVPLSRLPFRVYSTDILIEGVGWVELVCQVQRQRKGIQRLPVPESSNTDPASSAQSSSADIILHPEMDFEPYLKLDEVEDDASTKQTESEFAIPKVEIVSPNGKHIAQRRPLGAWLKWNERRQQAKKH